MPSVEERLAVLEDREGRNARDIRGLSSDVAKLVIADASGNGVTRFIGSIAPWLALVVAVLGIVWR